MILIFGGTSDSIKICEELNEKNIDYILSVATKYGIEISQNIAKNLIGSRMNEEEIIEFVKTNNIDTIIDATHPYASEVSKNAMRSAKKCGIKYIRYERPSSDLLDNDNIYLVDSTNEAINLANNLGDNVFLATGSKTLAKFVNGLKEKNVLARVLPTSDVLNHCEEIGLLAHNIIAMKGPFTYDINKALYRFYNVDILITKESGAEGGFKEKVLSALDLGIKTIIITRPKLEYENVINNIDEVIKCICLGV